jgi:hypothetical protein
MEGQCFLKPKAADKALLKTLPPVEVIEEPDDGQVSTMVVDSDDEGDLVAYTPTPAPTHVFAQVQQVAQETVSHQVEEETVEEVKPAAAKKKVVRKKTDA